MSITNLDDLRRELDADKQKHQRLEQTERAKKTDVAKDKEKLKAKETELARAQQVVIKIQSEVTALKAAEQQAETELHHTQTEMENITRDRTNKEAELRKLVQETERDLKDKKK